MDGPPPPPPPPHGANPKTTSGLPPGNYDIFIVPPHSSGSGFLYLPSLQCHRNSFIAGVSCAFIAVWIWTMIEPSLKIWFSTIATSSGGPGIVVLVIGVGVLGWALGKTQMEGGFTGAKPNAHARPGGAAGGPAGAAPPPGFGASSPPPQGGFANGGPPPPHSHHPGGAGPQPGWGSNNYQQHNYAPPPRSPPSPRPRPEYTQPPPPPKPEYTQPPPPKPEYTQPPPPRPEPAQPPPPKPEPAQPPPPKPAHTQPSPPKPQPTQMPPPKPEPKAPPKPQAAPKPDPPRPNAAAEWEKARAETKRREEQRRREEDVRRRQEEEKKKKEEAEKQARAAAEKEKWEKMRAREKEAREREARERLAKEKAEKDAKAEPKPSAASDAQAKLKKEIREKIEQEKKNSPQETPKEKADRERAERLKAARERVERMAKEGTKSGGNTFGVGERTNPYAGSNYSSGSPTKGNYEKPSAKSYLGTEDTHSFRPYDQAPRAPRRAAPSAARSMFSESSYAPSQTTARTSPPPSQRGAYSTSDPDKIVIKGVYLFNDLFPKPIAQLVSGIGHVTDGLILRITTEGLFIDDDVRGVPQREWDVKAWTMKLVETGEKGPRHVLRASIRDPEGKKYVFVLPEEENWKVQKGIAKLRKGTQVRSLGVNGLSVSESKKLLEGLGYM
ncbi:hypothetical protein EJ05DRAFT_371568 [Pseudovirgaria hyperparasitica]|uniref:Uncharacterized protein n=1 Tax=Pseudovirgaria hyperparasitica TaxID=470096 RepID=A0A6A6W8K5_9PEZI|nr:uncharacterized protein EJ05DRAFT_371568 [Pseudovirgaria hyperparasitica]KAF2757907.1 hypothetical protein EJ05DRAFT_371568 [Pseudovirgaria hyperparasitica]